MRRSWVSESCRSATQVGNGRSLNSTGHFSLRSPPTVMADDLPVSSRQERLLRSDTCH